MVEPVSAIIASVDGLVNVADKLGALEVVKSKLMSRPDRAASHLADVLRELLKIYEELEREIVKYLGVSLDPSEGLARDRAALLELESGVLASRMYAAKTSCSRIGSIYDRFLRGWFSRLLNRQEAAALDDLFRRLSVSDTLFEANIRNTASWVSSKAELTLSFVDRGEYDEARKTVREARLELRPARISLIDSIGTLRDLQGTFISLSGAL